MNARELKPIHRALSPYFPGFTGHKRLFLKAPINGMLRAIHFDPSAFDKVSFYPSSLVMPLFVPWDHISLMFGNRLHHNTESYYWTANLPNLVPDLVTAIREQGLPVLAQAADVDGFIALGRNSRGNPHTERSIAFVLARAGDRGHALDVINGYLPKLNLQTQWEKDIFDTSARLRDLLIHDPNAADRQLQEWENYTIQKLRLEAFR
jgi:hypothetical protein